MKGHRQKTHNLLESGWGSKRGCASQLMANCVWHAKTVSFARKKTHQHADLIQHGIQNNNQTSKIIRFSKTSGFVCKPRVFEQTLEKLRFWICKVYIIVIIIIIGSSSSSRSSSSIIYILLFDTAHLQNDPGNTACPQLWHASTNPWCSDLLYDVRHHCGTNVHRIRKVMQSHANIIAQYPEVSQNHWEWSKIPWAIITCRRP